MDNQTMNIISWGIALSITFFLFFIILSPIIKLLDRISLVVEGITPETSDLEALKIYWYLAKNSDVLKKIEEKNANGEKFQYNDFENLINLDKFK